MSYVKKTRILDVSVHPRTNSTQVIKIRQSGVKELTAYIQKIDKNIKIFKEAIGKEVAEKTRVRAMIKSLKTDIKEAKSLKTRTPDII